MGISISLFAQQSDFVFKQYAEAGVAASTDEDLLINAAVGKNWLLKKSGFMQNLYVGTGVRFTAFSGKNASFTSAIPSLYGTDMADTLTAASPNINSLNLYINLGVNIGKKMQIGFDLDALGFSFGPNGTPSYMSNGKTQAVSAKPTSVNALLVGANDRGTLDGGLYIRYKISEKWGLKAQYHTVFTELTTDKTYQTSPENNDRFRYGTNPIGLAISYHF